MTLLIMIALWLILGLIVGAAASTIWKEARPYGETGDYAVAIIASIATGLLDWYVLPLLGIEGFIRFVVALTEPPLVALLALWIMRKAAKRTPQQD